MSLTTLCRFSPYPWIDPFDGQKSFLKNDLLVQSLSSDSSGESFAPSVLPPQRLELFSAGSSALSSSGELIGSLAPSSCRSASPARDFLRIGFGQVFVF